MAVDYKQYINGLNSAMPDADMNAAALAKRRWDSIAKPLGSLGKLDGGAYGRRKRGHIAALRCHVLRG